MPDVPANCYILYRYMPWVSELFCLRSHNLLHDSSRAGHLT